MKSVLEAAILFVLTVGLALLLTYPEMWLINYVFSPTFLLFVFGVAKLTFWRTYVTMITLGLIFRGINTAKSKGK